MIKKFIENPRGYNKYKREHDSYVEVFSSDDGGYVVRDAFGVIPTEAALDVGAEDNKEVAWEADGSICPTFRSYRVKGYDELIRLAEACEGVDFICLCRVYLE